MVWAWTGLRMIWAFTLAFPTIQRSIWHSEFYYHNRYPWDSWPVGWARLYAWNGLPKSYSMGCGICFRRYIKSILASFILRECSSCSFPPSLSSPISPPTPGPAVTIEQVSIFPQHIIPSDKTAHTKYFSTARSSQKMKMKNVSHVPLVHHTSPSHPPPSSHTASRTRPRTCPAPPSRPPARPRLPDGSDASRTAPRPPCPPPPRRSRTRRHGSPRPRARRRRRSRTRRSRPFRGRGCRLGSGF